MHADDHAAPISVPITVSSGTTCVDDALVVGKVTVKPGAGLFVTEQQPARALTSTGATEVTVCGSGVSPPSRSRGARRSGSAIPSPAGGRTLPRIGDGDGHRRADGDRWEPDHRSAGVHRQRPAADQQRRSQHRLRPEVRPVLRAVAPTHPSREVSAPLRRRNFTRSDSGRCRSPAF